MGFLKLKSLFQPGYCFKGFLRNGRLKCKGIITKEVALCNHALVLHDFYVEKGDRDIGSYLGEKASILVYFFHPPPILTSKIGR